MCRLCSCQKNSLGFNEMPLLITLCGYVVPWSVVALGNRKKKEDEIIQMKLISIPAQPTCNNELA